MQRRWLLWLLLTVLVVVIALSMAMGAVPIPLSKVLSGDAMSLMLIKNYRLPRTLVGALVGAELAVAGAMLQSVTRNPLADPHVTGVSAGAGLVAVGIFLAVPTFPMTLVPLAALVGGVVAGAIVYTVAWRGGIHPGRLALSGIAISTVLSAGTSALLLKYSLTANAAMVWLAGGLWGRNWDHLQALAPWALPALGLAWLLGPRIDVLALGDDVARGLGAAVERERAMIMALAVLLAASAVAVAGPVGFVGLVIPHLARIVAGGAFRRLLPVAALLGAALVVLSDALARSLFAPMELPAGVFTALIGAPYFLYLLRRAAL
jgi:iron complex transport system permease protein